MDAVHPLKTLLQLQLASDALAVLHLPYVLSTLKPEVLQPSSHTQKWTTRVNSLIHSKDAGARWAGLCLAYQTSIYSKSLMLECAQSWVTVVLPLLSKNENVPTLKAAVRLLRAIFTNAKTIPEFQRQVSTPNLPKFSAALVLLIEKHADDELRLLAIQTLTHLIPLYPTVHRALQASISSLALRFLNGSTPTPMPPSLLESASRLYGVLHHTGGKVGAANNWRKSLDDTLAFGWGAFWGLRTTFNRSGYAQSIPQASTSTEDPVMTIPLHLDRLRAAITVLSDLLQASTLRPVTLPMGSIVRFCEALLSCNGDEKVEGHVDPTIRSMELSVQPDIWVFGCKLLEVLAQCAQRHLAPHLSRLCSQISRHLEQKYALSLRNSFLRALSLILSECPLGDSLLASRLARAVLPSLTSLLDAQSDVQREENAPINTSKGRKGKKRARGYEGDELFKTTKEVMLPTKEAEDVVLLALEVIWLLASRSPLTPSVQSITARVLLAVYVGIPHIPPSLFSPNPATHLKVYQSVQRICTELGTGTTSTLSKSLGLVIGASLYGPVNFDLARKLDLELHPRVPPLIRALPHVESLSLFRAEENEEEGEIRHVLGITTLDELRSLRQKADNAVEQTAQPEVFRGSRGNSSTPNLMSSSFAASISDATAVALPPTPSQPSAAPESEPPRPAAPAFPSNLDAAPSASTQSPHSLPKATPSAAEQPLSTMVDAPVPIVVDDEDEPMPSIVMDSDSDESTA